MNHQDVTALVSWPSAALTESLVRRSLDALDPPPSVVSSLQRPCAKLIQWSTYDSIDHELTHADPHNVLSSSYTFRKALIRKHFLSRCIHLYSTKRIDSVLKQARPTTWEIELSFADELEEMWSDELWELGKELEDRTKWWILKPGMADRGMGIRMFSSKGALQQIFEEFEDVSDDDEVGGDETTVVTSQLRHFIVQEYLSVPLLLDPAQVRIDKELTPRTLDSLEGHKFHLRVYCVASGALTVYLCTRILALFSSVPYYLPSAGSDEDVSIDLTPHLTNTSLQTHRGEEGVRLLDELVGCRVLSASGHEDATNFTEADVTSIIDQVSDILAETFKAAVEMPVHFQPLPNAFELYGVDFLVTHISDPGNGSLDHPPSHSPSLLQVNLLEVNAEPAVELTGARLTWVLEDLFMSISKVCIAPFVTPKDHAVHAEYPTWAVGETRYNFRKCSEVNVHQV